MKLWYTKWELPEARKEAQELVDRMNAEIPTFIRGPVKLRMTWRDRLRSREVTPIDEIRVFGDVALQTFIPEAELLVDGEVARCDLLDCLLLDLNHMQMNLFLKERAGLLDNASLK